MKLIIGLGNPGEKYNGTRHNLGFMVVEGLVKSEKGKVKSWKFEEKFKAEILQLDSSLITSEAIPFPLILVKPQTHMNLSGLAASLVANFYKIKPEDVIIIHDDLDLMLGKIKVRQGGAAGGHHGVESIIKALGTDQFIRVRLGVGNDKSHSGEHHRISFNAEKFVVEPFLSSEKPRVKHMEKQAVEAINILLEKGLEVAQNQFN